LTGLPDDLQRAYLSRSIVPDPSEAVIVDTPVPGVYSSDNIDLNPRGTPDKSTEQLAAEHRLTEALMRFPVDVRDAVLDEARRLNGIIERYLALPNKREKVAALSLTNGNGDLQISDSTTNRRFKSRLCTCRPFALCKEVVCTNETIINYASRCIQSGGTQPRCTKAISPVTLDNWSRRVRKKGCCLPADAAKLQETR
jgi:hypothetical protein